MTKIQDAVENARKAGIRIRRAEALRLMVTTLAEGNGYYNWTPLGSNSAFLLREPRPELMESEKWLQSERFEVIHICQPVKMVVAVADMDREQTVSYSGYVRNGVCHKCQSSAPHAVLEDVRARVKTDYVGELIDPVLDNPVDQSTLYTAVKNEETGEHELVRVENNNE